MVYGCRVCGRGEGGGHWVRGACSPADTHTHTAQQRGGQGAGMRAAQVREEGQHNESMTNQYLI